MRGHLPATGAGIVSRAHGVQEHFVRSGTQRETERAVPIVRIEPVVTRLQGKSRGHAHRFMPRAGDLEEDLLLTLEHDLPIVDAPGGEHDAISFNQLLGGEALIAFAGFLNIAVGQAGWFGICL